MSFSSSGMIMSPPIFFTSKGVGWNISGLRSSGIRQPRKTAHATTHYSSNIAHYCKQGVTSPFRFYTLINLINVYTTRGGGGYSHKWPIWVCAAPNPPLFTLTRSQTPHYLPWPVRWTPIFLSLSVRSPHKIYRDSFVHHELWNYLSLVGNWLFRTLVFGLKMSQIAPQSIYITQNFWVRPPRPPPPLTWGGHPLPHPPPRLPSAGVYSSSLTPLFWE